MNIGKFLAVCAVILASAISQAQEHDIEMRNRFYVGPRLHFNISAKMQNHPVPANIGPQYDDGYVDEDISENFGGKTWNWGYSFTNQIFGASPNRQLELHGANSPRDGAVDSLDNIAQYGFEIGYGRELWRFGREDYPIRVGIEGSFSASALRLDENNTISGTVTRFSDRFSLGSVIPPNPPYNGPFRGPEPPNPSAPLISTNRLSRTTTTETATSTQRSEIEGTYWGFRLGPFIEVPWPGYRHSFSGGLGLAMINADATLSYEESFTITGLGGPPQPRSDAQSSQAWLFGFYLNAKAHYWATDFVSFYVGTEFQFLEDFELSALDKSAKVDFGSTLGVTVGVMYVF